MPHQDNDELRNLSTNTIWIVVGIGGTLIIFTISILFVFGWFSRDLEVTALLGDSFAAINALFSSLAIGGMFEDHVVPLKLTPEFATKTLVAYTNDMLIEVNRLFDPISRNELTDHD